MSLFTGEFVNIADGSICGAYKIQTIYHAIFEITASSATKGYAFIAPGGYQVVSVREIHAVAGGTSAALNLERLVAGTAPGSGIAILTTAMVLTGTANTSQSTATSNIINTAGITGTQLVAGDSLGFVLSGTLTGLANCTVEVGLARV
jgi:hypothetical protein